MVKNLTLGLNLNAVILCNIIVKNVLCCVILTTVSNYIKKKLQLLLYI